MQPSTFTANVVHLTPTHALLTLTLGLALIYLELNRPGKIFPGAIGLALTLIAVPSLFSYRIGDFSVLLIALATIILATGLRRHIHPSLSTLATLALVAAFRGLPGVNHLAATLCGLLLGAGTSALTAIALRARRNKGLD